MSLSYRFGSFQPFTRLTSSEDGRQSGVQFGVVTYNTVDDKETYQVSSFEIAGRSDHVSDVIIGLTGSDVEALSTVEPLSDDKDLLRKAKDDRSKSDNQPAEAAA